MLGFGIVLAPLARVLEFEALDEPLFERAAGLNVSSIVVAMLWQGDHVAFEDAGAMATEMYELVVACAQS